MSDENHSPSNYSLNCVNSIVQFLRGESFSIPFSDDKSSQTQLLQIFAHHGLAGYILSHPNYKHLDSSLQKAIKALYLNVSVRNTQLFETYNRISEKFKLSNIEFLPLKGAFLLPSVYGDIAARNISDLDILIHPNDYDCCKAILLEMGATQFEEESEQFLQNLGHQYAPYWLYNTSIELHNRILSLNLRYAIPVEDVWNNLVDYNSTASVCKGIEPNLLVIYLAMHIHYSEMRGEYRVYWYMDIAKLLNLTNRVDVSQVLALSKRYGNTKPLLKVLSKVSYLFNFEIAGVKRLNTNQINSFLQNLSQLKKPANKGYSIAIERVIYTKGLKNKIRFVKQSLLNGSVNSPKEILNRLSSVGIKLIGYLVKRR